MCVRVCVCVYVHARVYVCFCVCVCGGGGGGGGGWGGAWEIITQKGSGVFSKGGEVLTPLQTTDYFTNFVVQVRKIKTLQKGKQ